jgi:hypothetical protein
VTAVLDGLISKFKFLTVGRRKYYETRLDRG